jgi:hypothetical protein
LRALKRLFLFTVGLFVLVYMLVSIAMAFYYQGDNFNVKYVFRTDITVCARATLPLPRPLQPPSAPVLSACTARGVCGPLS